MSTTSIPTPAPVIDAGTAVPTPTPANFWINPFPPIYNYEISSFPTYSHVVSNNNDNSVSDKTSLIAGCVGAFVIVIGVVVLTSIIYSNGQRITTTSMSEAERRRRLAAAQFATSQRLPPSTAPQHPQVADLTTAQRRQLVEILLKTEKYATETGNDTNQKNENTLMEDVKAGDDIDIVVEAENDTNDAGGLDGAENVDLTNTVAQDQCAICLESFERDDSIALSQDPACHHIYHRECMSEWLEMHIGCPICRRDFLNLDQFLHDMEFGGNLSERILGRRASLKRRTSSLRRIGRINV